MSIKIIRNLLFTSMVGFAMVAWNPTQPVYAMPSCAELNCEGNYFQCVNECQVGDVSCLLTCQQDEQACDHITCTSPMPDGPGGYPSEGWVWWCNVNSATISCGF